MGTVGRLGTWAPPADADQAFGADNAYSFMVCPRNVTTPGVDAVFASCRRLGWETLACSPFVRGWHLDKMVVAAAGRVAGDGAEVRARLADLMLRHSLFAPDVDRLIVAIRDPRWVAANAESCRRGPLNQAEQSLLASIVSDVA